MFCFKFCIKKHVPLKPDLHMVCSSLARIGGARLYSFQDVVLLELHAVSRKGCKRQRNDQHCGQ